MPLRTRPQRSTLAEVEKAGLQATPPVELGAGERERSRPDRPPGTRVESARDDLASEPDRRHLLAGDDLSLPPSQLGQLPLFLTHFRSMRTAV